MGMATWARDAMSQVGRFVIETHNVVLNEHHSGIHQAVYVELSFTHSGAATPPTELSTTYAFITESGGHITAESEVRGGTTVSFYFPAHASPD
jgi:hypothetical protein